MKHQHMSDFRLSELLARKVLGSITEKETAELEQWVNLNADNRQFYNQFMAQSSIGKRFERHEEFDINEHWNQFVQRAGNREHKASRSLSILIKYAAIIALPVLIGAAVYLTVFNKKDVPNSQAFSNKAPAGIVLYTSTGEKINLDDASKIENGVVVKDKDTKELVYDATASVKDQYHTIIVPAQRDFKIQLADGSTVWLNAGTTFTYPVAFNGNIRQVQLDGEAFFDIKHNEKQPFLVKTNGINVEDIGTSFNVKSYKAESKTTTTLVSGKAKMTDPANVSATALLEPGFQSSYITGSGQMQVREVDVNPAIAWKEGRFDFEDQALGEIMSDLGRWYGAEVEFENEQLRKVRFKGSVSKTDSFERIANILEGTGKVKISVAGNKIYVK
ncbi:DUF4974 domain-containing protein [Pedobacter sp. HMF7647]|uniref:DUF4974 domain-containing protein n=1 Tax=Hufsiella arboris TaxID=2695275 RepID=A0A7K1YD43_9SPHI|nr:FecR domain-containing protein [Hufsiella arboris]MXV52340.1 DUF4974 domain-containing protein [Hufsiella arboris]